MERVELRSGAPWEAQVGYSRAVRVGDTIAVTGTTAIAADGSAIGEDDAYAQTVAIFETIDRALRELGSCLEHVLRTRIFVVDIEGDWAAVGRAHREAFGERRPATTMVEIRRLIAPWMRLEIEVDALVVPADVQTSVRTLERTDSGSRA